MTLDINAVRYITVIAVQADRRPLPDLKVKPEPITKAAKRKRGATENLDAVSLSDKNTRENDYHQAKRRRQLIASAPDVRADSVAVPQNSKPAKRYGRKGKTSSPTPGSVVENFGFDDLPAPTLSDLPVNPPNEMKKGKDRIESRVSAMKGKNGKPGPKPRTKKDTAAASVPPRAKTNLIVRPKAEPVCLFIFTSMVLLLICLFSDECSSARHQTQPSFSTSCKYHYPGHDPRRLAIALLPNKLKTINRLPLAF